MTAKDEQSRAIEILKFPLAVMVVAIHCYYFNTQEINYIARDNPSLYSEVVKWIINLCSIIITECAVPLFFVISGYLYFFKQETYTFKEYINKTKNKCYTLLLPYIVWNVMAIIFYPNLFLDANPLQRILGFWSRNFHWYSSSGPWDGPLWFIRDLFVVMLFAPLISKYILLINNKLIRGGGILIPLLLGVPYFLGFENLIPGISFRAFFYFSLGVLIIIYSQNFNKILQNKIITILIVILFILFGFLRISTFYDSNFKLKWWFNFGWIITQMLFYFKIALIISKNKIIIKLKIWKLLGASSFVIFAMHNLILGRISSSLLWLVGKHNVGSGLTLLFYFATITIAVIICFLFHIIISKNRITSLIFQGSRNR